MSLKYRPIVPVVAFGLLMSLAGTRVGAEDAKPAKGETGSVSGTVVDKDGKPAANAKVRLVHPNARGGHGPGKPTDKVIQSGADVLAFLAYWTGLHPTD